MQAMLLSVESASDIPVSGVLTFRSGSREIEILREGKDDKNRELVLWLDFWKLWEYGGQDNKNWMEEKDKSFLQQGRDNMGH